MKTLLSLASLILPASAIDFDAAVFDSANSPTRPTADPDGSKLVAHANEAAARWEQAVLDTHSIALTVRYDTTAPAKGRLEILGVSGGKATNVRIRIHPSQDWYFDGTPTSDGEFFPASTFAFEENPADALYPFTGTPPGRLEMSYSGVTIGANASKPDLLTVLIHHLGRALGFSDTFSAARAEIDGDGDVDLPSSWVAGQTMGVQNDVGANPDDYSLATVNSSLNYLAIASPGRRSLPSALDLLVIRQLGGWTSVRIPRMEFLRTGTRSFTDTLNWPGGSLPATTAAVFLRQTATTTVTLGTSRSAASMEIGGNTSLTLSNAALTLSGSADVLHNGNVFQIPALSIPDSSTLTAGSVNVTGGILEVGGGTVSASSVFISPASTTGRRGTLRLGGTILADSFSNSGQMEITGNSVCQARTLASAPWDLDGGTAQTDAELLVSGGDLAFEDITHGDSFDGTFTVAANRKLTLAGSLSFSADAVCTLAGGSIDRQADSTAQLRFDGPLDVTQTSTIALPSIIDFWSNVDIQPATTQLIFRAPPDFRFATKFGETAQSTGKVVFEPLPNAPWGYAMSLRGNHFPKLRLVLGQLGDMNPFGSGSLLRFQSLEMTDFSNNLAFEIGNADATAHDRWLVDDAAQLQGSLSVTFAENSVPVPGQTWRLIEAGTRSGQFSALYISGADPADFELLYDATGVTLRMLGGEPTLADWLAERSVPSNQRGIDDDPDDDGVPNGIEALFDLDPMATDRPHIVPSAIVIGDQSFGAAEIRVTQQVFADLELKVEASYDLDQWSVPLLIHQSEPPSGGTVVQTWRTIQAVGPPGRIFLRVRAMQAVEP
jgi:hypothetical protein